MAAGPSRGDTSPSAPFNPEYFGSFEEQEAVKEITQFLLQEKLQLLEKRMENMEKYVHERMDNLEEKFRETLGERDRALEDCLSRHKAEAQVREMRFAELEDRLFTLEVYFHGAPITEVEPEALTEALTDAALDGRAEEVRSLIARGASVNAENYGRTAMYFAASAGSAEVLTVLLRHGADVNVMDLDGESPLHAAAQNGSEDCVKILIDAGALLEASDNRGRTPLHMAAAKGHLQIARQLLAAGAASTAKDNIGRSAEEMAANEDIRNLFREFTDA